MPKPAGTLWYDGAARDRSDATARIERDALAFVAARVRDLEADDSPWRVLIDELGVPCDLDEETYATVARSPSVQMRGDELVVGLASVFPRRLEAIHAAARAQPWCARARLDAGRIVMKVRVDLAHARRIERGIHALAEELREALRSGVLALLAFIEPQGSPLVSEALKAGLREVDRVEAAKLATLASVRVG